MKLETGAAGTIASLALTIRSFTASGGTESGKTTPGETTALATTRFVGSKSLIRMSAWLPGITTWRASAVTAPPTRPPLGVTDDWSFADAAPVAYGAHVSKRPSASSETAAKT